MSKKSGTWYVVADGRKARVLVSGEGGMRTQHSFDASGRGNVVEDADSGVSQLKAPKADPKDQAEAHFAKAIAEHLNEAIRRHQTDGRRQRRVARRKICHQRRFVPFTQFREPASDSSVTHPDLSGSLDRYRCLYRRARRGLRETPFPFPMARGGSLPLLHAKTRAPG